MSTTIMVCLGIISLCTLAIGVSNVIVYMQDIKLKRIEEKNKKIHLLDFGPPSADETQREIPVVKYAKWLPYCPDYFGYTEDFECENCHNLSKMPVVNAEICYFEYCPHCGMKMMYMKGD